MAVRPIRSEASNEVLDLLKKAKALEEKIVKAAMCADCDKLKKDCGCGVKKYGSMKKGSPDFITSFSTEPQDVTFVSESGGQTRNAYYTTNQHLLDSTDVANKGANKSSVDIAALSDSLNTHGHPVKSHLTEG
tara:strand:+ start:575 stop:973 length:399 start_codon:yes stop_codon:yes gene_type:complete